MYSLPGVWTGLETDGAGIAATNPSLPAAAEYLSSSRVRVLWVQSHHFRRYTKTSQ